MVDERRNGYIDLNKEFGELKGLVVGLIKSSDKQAEQLTNSILRLEDRAEKSFVKTDKVLNEVRNEIGEHDKRIMVMENRWKAILWILGGGATAFASLKIVLTMIIGG